MAKKIFFQLIIFVSFKPIAFAAVWVDSASWSPQWEKTYQVWVSENWKKDFFSRRSLPNGEPNPYYGIRADCADTVYSVRAIFSYENKLPFAVHDPTGGTVLISNKMSRFDSISDPNERFLKFLRTLYGLVSTRSLADDTYSIAPSRKSVGPGTIIRTVERNHHSWTIKNILSIGVPHLIYNSRVHKDSSAELYERVSWPNPAWVFQDNYSPGSRAGLRAWRPLAYLNVPEQQVPGYSEEQFRIGLKNWNRIVQGKIATVNEATKAQLERLLKTACSGFQERIKVVREGVKNLHRSGGCYDESTYDIYSTPNRDQRVFDDLIELRKTFQGIVADNRQDQIDPDFFRKLSKIYPDISGTAAKETEQMPEQMITADSVCKVDYEAQKSIDLAEAKRRLFAGLMSNNPLDESSFRWGETRGPSARARSCPDWDSWTPSFGPDDHVGWRDFLSAGLADLPNRQRILEIENIHFTNSKGEIRRLHIRPFESNSQSVALELIVYGLDQDQLPFPVSEPILDPSSESIQKILEGGRIFFHEKKYE